MEWFGDLYLAVRGFWEIPVLVCSIIMAIAYIIYAGRNVARAYIQTGELPQWSGNMDASPWDELKDPHLVFGFFGALLLTAIPSFFLVIWPFSAGVLILTGIVIIPVRRQRKKVMFIQALKGEDRA